VLAAGREALRIDGSLPNAELNLGDALTRLGRYDAARRAIPCSHVRCNFDDSPGLKGRKVLEANGHGLGDTIQFYIIACFWRAQGGEVTFAGAAKMGRHMVSLDAVVAWLDEKDFSGAFDARIAISSLPRACSTRPEGIPASRSYLRPGPERMAPLARKDQGAGPKIDLCWHGNIDFRVDPRRSIVPEVLLPHVLERRWMNKRVDSPWYPTMRLLRYSEGSAPFAEITEEIRRKFAV
jgi:hypothetical protein